MIEYIRGELTELTPALATIEAAGVGYGLNISLNTYEACQRHGTDTEPRNGHGTDTEPRNGHGTDTEPRNGHGTDTDRARKIVKLYVYEAIREDAHVLYGFYNKKEREMFEQLITVSGVGANTARMMLSGMSVPELCQAISTGNAKLIQSIKGIGKMTAQRIIVDLRDKIVALGIADEIPAGGTIAAPVNNAVRDEAVAALTMLGFSPAPTQKVVVAILQQQPDLPVEQVVKLALKQIK